MSFKPHLNDALCLLLVLFLGVMAWPLAMSPHPIDWLMAAILALGALRLVYEVTFNRTGEPTIASGYFAQRAMINAIKQHAGGKTDYRITDMGSGRGGFAQRIARALPQAQVTGYERNSIPYHYARFVQQVFGPKNLVYRQDDFMNIDCAESNATTIFLSAKATKMVGEKLQRELPAGALVASNHFELSAGWQPVDVIKPPYSFGASVYIYRA